MAYQVEWSPKALDDVEAIAVYISRDSASYAAAVVKKILDVTRSLNHCPTAGEVVPEFDDDNVRQQFAYMYRIIYRIKGQTVTVAAVTYKKKLLEEFGKD
ncbi:type II toxin-antitoxin system RelE/ParE family toxin [Calothrix sp. CCY 0018]|uniref:type II toxin-antitoxin system RelE/ParE family toxin n=1 Tax=Calothrix sp. CCY 0018 TaxID=3103864 RepID=UPI0039C62D27